MYKRTDQNKPRKWIGALAVTTMIATALTILGAPTAVSADELCTSEVKNDVGSAKNSFRSRCGRNWNDQVRDQCTWVNDPAGWICHSYAPNGVSAPSRSGNSSGSTASTTNSPAPGKPNTPRFVEAVDRGRYNGVVWRTDSSLKGVNVYRDGRFVGSVNMPNNVFNDYGGDAGATYTLVGYSSSNSFSAKSGEQRAVAVVAGGSKVRWHPRVMHLSWNSAPGARKYYVYRNSRFIGTAFGTEFTDRYASGNNTYTIHAVDARNGSGPASPALRGPARIMMRNGTLVTTGETVQFTTSMGANRTFTGTMTVDADTGISFEGTVRDGRGNNLGGLSQYHDGTNLVVETTSRYGPNEKLNGVGDPMELAPFTGVEFVGSLYNGRPVTTTGGGDGDGPVVDEPFGGHCNSACQDERNTPR